MMTHNEKLLFLINYLLDENHQYKNIAVPTNEAEQFLLFRTLVNVRLPKAMDDAFLRVQDEFLREEAVAKGITDISDLTPIENNIYLWQGDITTLKCGAIVNAANSGLTGCYCPCHSCIDNAVHTFAGAELRLECSEIIHKQGFPELTGNAKITRAYNLPCDFIIHTVGPIIQGTLKKSDTDLLKSCYEKCLTTANENGINSIAFCCISTGEFHFPNDKAAQIAVDTVRNYLNHNKEIKVIFNVFKDADYKIYKQLLG